MKSFSFKEIVLTLLNLRCLAFASFDGGFSQDLDRRFTCTVPGYTQCPQAGLPNDFCCPSDHVCLSLGASFTILCCPAGSDCSYQNPVSCDIELQNATSHPESLIKTTDLSSDMFTCASGCCPFGFNCTSTGSCAMFEEQKQIIDAELSTLSLSSTSSSAPTAAPSTFHTTLFSATLAANTGFTPLPTNATASGLTSNRRSISFSPGALAGGIIALVLVIVSIAGFLAWFYMKKRASTNRMNLAVESKQESRSSLRGGFQKAELDSESSRVELDGLNAAGELDGLSLRMKHTSDRRELEGHSAHEVSGGGMVYEMDGEMPEKSRFVK